MENIPRLLAVSISEFKRTPEEVVAKARRQPVAVLNRNRPVFYAVSPEVMVLRCRPRRASSPSTPAATKRSTCFCALPRPLSASRNNS